MRRSIRCVVNARGYDIPLESRAATHSRDVPRARMRVRLTPVINYRRYDGRNERKRVGHKAESVPVC